MAEIYYFYLSIISRRVSERLQFSHDALHFLVYFRSVLSQLFPHLHRTIHQSSSTLRFLLWNIECSVHQRRGIIQLEETPSLTWPTLYTHIARRSRCASGHPRVFIREILIASKIEWSSYFLGRGLLLLWSLEQLRWVELTHAMVTIKQRAVAVLLRIHVFLSSLMSGFLLSQSETEISSSFLHFSIITQGLVNWFLFSLFCLYYFIRD